FYLPDNAVPAVSSTSLLPLDSLLSADASFNKDDIPASLMSVVQRESKTYALPLDLSPMILRYDSAQFSAAGLSAPANDWTVDAFADALKALKPDKQSPTPFWDSITNGSYLFVLIASYGGLPIDYRTTPPTINFTDPANIAAIQQVLDLAKNGYI